jgi:hypothetical protein
MLHVLIMRSSYFNDGASRFLLTVFTANHLSVWVDHDFCVVARLVLYIRAYYSSTGEVLEFDGSARLHKWNAATARQRIPIRRSAYWNISWRYVFWPRYCNFAKQCAGHVFPGATLPFGLAKAVSDVNGENQGGFSTGGGNIIGFSHMHDSGELSNQFF